MPDVNGEAGASLTDTGKGGMVKLVERRSWWFTPLPSLDIAEAQLAVVEAKDFALKT